MFNKKLDICIYGHHYKVPAALYYDIDLLQVELKQKDYIIRRLREKLGEIEEDPLTTPIYKENNK